MVKLLSKFTLIMGLLLVLFILPSCLFPPSTYEEDIAKIEQRRESPTIVEPTQKEPVINQTPKEVIIESKPIENTTQVETILVPEVKKPVFNMTETNFAYFLNEEEDELYIYNLNTSRIVDTLNLDVQPYEIIIDSKGEYGYISSTGDDTIQILDLSKRRINETFDVGDTPRGLALDRRDRTLMVGVNSNEIEFYDVRDFNNIDMFRKVDVDDKPHMLLADVDNYWLYVSHPDSDIISVIDIDNDVNDTEPKEIITSDLEVEGLAISPAGKYLYALSQDEDFITIYRRDNDWDSAGDIELERRGQSKRAGFAPNGLLFVTNYNLDSVTVLDVDRDKVVQTIKVGDKPIGITFNGNKAWIANYGSSFVTIIDSENFLTQNVTIPEVGVRDIEFG